jgi:hypothetical protein
MADNNFAGQLGGAAIGGGLGLVGGILGSIDRERQQRRFRRRQREGIDAARELTEERVSNLMDDPLITAARDYLSSSFAEDGTDPLSEQFAKRLRVAQEARGLRRSTAGAVAEASSLAAFRQQHLASMLPQMRSFGTLGEDYRQRILTQEVPWNVAYYTGAAVPGIQPPAYIPSAVTAGFEGFVSGAMGGAQIGGAMTQQNPYQQYMGQIAANERYDSLQQQLDALINNQDNDPFAGLTFDLYRS